MKCIFLLKLLFKIIVQMNIIYKLLYILLHSVYRMFLNLGSVAIQDKKIHMSDELWIRSILILQMVWKHLLTN